MRELLTSQGRIPRSTFWKYFGCLYGAMIVVAFVSEKAELPEPAKALLMCLLLPFMLIGILVQIKRWHDRDKSGWWVLINFIPCLGGIWALIELGFLPGTAGPNRFGPDPFY